MTDQKSTDTQPSPLEELTSTGEGSGLEVEKMDAAIHTPFDPDQIDVVTQPYTVDLLLSRIDDDALNLSPEFQRRANLWNETRQSQLIESMLLKIPLPSLYVSEDADGVFSVVDGLQRLSAITKFLNAELLGSKLGVKIAPLKLTGLESLKELENHYFKDLPRPYQRRLRETQLTLHVIRPGTPPNVKFNVFARINQGGLPLTAQEIRNALYPGPGRIWLSRLAEDKTFLQATENKVKVERMGDVELVLRFVALYDAPHEKPRVDSRNLDDFLNETMSKINKWNELQWIDVQQQFIKSMKAAPRVFGRHAFRKVWGINNWRSPINRGLFEAQSIALARLRQVEIDFLAEHSVDVLNKVIHSLKHDEEFSNAVSYGTGSAQASNTRIKVMGKLLKEVLDAK
jgi:hypothetical protein